MTETVVCIPDTHYPAHDKKALAAVIRFIGEIQPDQVVHIGDLMDFPQPSRWTKDTRAEFEGSVYDDAIRCKREFLEPLREVYDGPVGVHEGNHDCVDEETRAVTDEGLKYLHELTGHERVMSVDDNGNTLWQPINKVVQYPFEGTLHRFGGRDVSALTTGNHRVVGLSVDKREWIERTPTNLPGRKMWVYSAGSGRQDDASISDEEIRLAAWALTDSHKSKYEWIFYQSGDKAQRIRELLEDTGIEYKERARERTTTEICGKVLKNPPLVSYEFVTKSELPSELVPNRDRLPQWVWHLSERQVKLFIDELVYCDGSISTSEKSQVVYVCREGLREDLQILCSANGIRASTTEYREGHWRLNICDRALSGIYRKDVSEVEYKGTVWCLQVPNERFFVEREGRIHLTGNCRTRDYMEKYAPALARTNMFDFDQLLEFEKYNVEKLPEFYDIAPGWVTTHGHRGGIRLNQNAGMTALNGAKRIGKSVVMGHTHRQGICSHTTGLGGKTDTITGVEVGHVMDPKKVTYLKGGTGNWQQGFTVLSIDGKHVTPQLIPIIQGRFIYQGEVFKI